MIYHNKNQRLIAIFLAVVLAFVGIFTGYIVNRNLSGSADYLLKVLIDGFRPIVPLQISADGNLKSINTTILPWDDGSILTVEGKVSPEVSNIRMIIPDLASNDIFDFTDKYIAIKKTKTSLLNIGGTQVDIVVDPKVGKFKYIVWLPSTFESYSFYQKRLTTTFKNEEFHETKPLNYIVNNFKLTIFIKESERISNTSIPPNGFSYLKHEGKKVNFDININSNTAIDVIIDNLSDKNLKETLTLIAGLILGIAASILVTAIIPDFSKES